MWRIVYFYVTGININWNKEWNRIECNNMRVLKKEKRTTINSIKGIVIDLRENKGKQEIRRENQDIRTKKEMNKK